MKRTIAWSHGTVYQEVLSSTCLSSEFGFYVRAYKQLRLAAQGKAVFRLRRFRETPECDDASWYHVSVAENMHVSIQIARSVIKNGISDLHAYLESRNRIMNDAARPVVTYDGTMPVALPANLANPPVP